MSRARADSPSPPCPQRAFQRRPATAIAADDEALRAAIGAAARGDRDALHLIYTRYKDNVYGYVCSIVRDEHEAEDVTQQVFAKVMLVVAKYERRPDTSFAGWLLRLSRNVAIDHLRRRRELLSVDGEPDDGAAAPEPARLELRDALAQLPAEQRSVIFLRHVVGLTPGEIADRMGRTESSIHGLHHRGRRALQRELEQAGLAPACAA